MQGNEVINALVGHFPEVPPKGLIITDSYGDGVAETVPFEGIPWKSVKPVMFRVNFEAFCFFSEEAFHYYLPALIKCSYESFEDTELAVDSLLRMLRMDAFPTAEMIKWRRARWSRLSGEQWHIVSLWIEDLRLKYSADCQSDLQFAAEAINSGVWCS